MVDMVKKDSIADEQEAIWIRAFLAGDRQQFDFIVRRYQDRVFNLCRRMLGDSEEANDCAQETFVKAFRSLARFRFASQFSTWLYAIAVNTCKNRLASTHYRFWTRFLQILPVAGAGEPTKHRDWPDPAPSPLSQLARAETERQVQAAIRTLPGSARALIILRDVEGLSYEEIARITGHRLGTVKSKLARARQALRERLKGVIA
jgi:RNA polymerase sigma-70 factor (ECF subfamily)